MILGICTFIVFSILTPGHNWSLNHFAFGDLFRNTTTNGGDMGAHVWMPWFLEKHWFGQGRLSGWAPDWYAGFPVGMYYFPLPNLMVAFLDLFLHYNIAFKLVTVSGPLMLPAAAYYVRKGHAGPVAGAARVRDRGARDARADAHELEHLRRQHREHAGR